MTLYPRYTLSLQAIEYLQTLKLPNKHPNRHLSYNTYEWDDTRSTLSTPLSIVPLQASHHTLRPRFIHADGETHRDNQGISKALIHIAETTPLQWWHDTRPPHVLKNAKHYPPPNATPAQIPAALLTSRTAANQYYQLYSPPKYTLPFFDTALLPTERKRYELRLSEEARNYYYQLALKFNMQPYHRGGRSTIHASGTRTALISVCLEAIGINYITYMLEVDD